MDCATATSNGMNKYFFRKDNPLLPLASALIAGLAFHVSGGWLLMLVAFTPFFIFLQHSSRSLKKTFFISCAAGTVFYAIALKLLFAAYPLDWAGIYGTAEGLLAFGTLWSLMMLTQGLAWGVFAVIISFIVRKKGSTYLVLLCGIPSLWVLMEYGQAFFFSVAVFSPGHSLIGPHWTWGNIAYAMVDGPGATIASVGGMYLLDYIMILTNVLVLLLFRYTPRISMGKRILLSMGGAVVFFTIVGLLADRAYLALWSHSASNALSLHIVGLQTDVLQSDINSQLSWEQEYQSLRNKLLSIEEKIDMLAIPEGALLETFLFKDTILQEKIHSDDTLILGYRYINEREGTVGETTYRRFNEGIIGFQKKEMIVPSGEYLPWVAKQVFILSGNNAIISAYDRLTLQGERKQAVVTDRIGTISAISCSEAMSPVFSRQAGKAGADFLVLQASDSIFKGDKAYLRLMLRFARMRAIEAGKPIVRVSNGGFSAVIDMFGNVNSFLPKGTGVLSADVGSVKGISLYARFGDWPVFLSMLAVFVLIFRRASPISSVDKKDYSR